MKKQQRKIDGYWMKKQLHGGFKIVEASHVDGQPSSGHTRTIYKNLTLSDAEDKLYRLESKLK